MQKFAINFKLVFVDRSGGMQSNARRRSSPETILDVPRKILKQPAEPPVKLAFALNPNTLPRL